MSSCQACRWKRRGCHAPTHLRDARQYSATRAWIASVTSDLAIATGSERNGSWRTPDCLDRPGKAASDRRCTWLPGPDAALPPVNALRQAPLSSGGEQKVVEMTMGEMPSGYLQRSDTDTYRLTDLQWSQLLAHLPGRVGTRARGNPCHYRRFVEQVLWVVDQDVVWHELQPDKGSWRSVYVRFLRWSDSGIWPIVIDVLADVPPLMEALQARIEEHRSYRDRCANSHVSGSLGIPVSRRLAR